MRILVRVSPGLPTLITQWDLHWSNVEAAAAAKTGHQQSVPLPAATTTSQPSVQAVGSGRQLVVLPDHFRSSGTHLRYAGGGGGGGSGSSTRGKPHRRPKGRR